jgi:hypothetical protein
MGSILNNNDIGITPKQTLLLILLPLLRTTICLRTYLHLVQVQHIYPGGYLLHHLFTGTLMIIPASFIMAFGVSNKLIGILSRISLGIGAALVLDEIAFLVMTKASDGDYTSDISLYGSLLLTSLAILLLFYLYKTKTKNK